MFLEDNEKNFPELEKFKLGDLEWDALKVFQDIMKVSTRLRIDSNSVIPSTYLETRYAGPTCFPTATISREDTDFVQYHSCV